MKFDFHPEAETEYLQSIDYYEECESGLGEEFALEVEAAIRNILSWPDAWPFLEGNLRRCFAHRFPYALIYSVEPDQVYILAVMHLYRHPGYWKDRKSRRTS